MAQTKIVDLAKDLDVKPTDVVHALQEMGIHLKNYQGISLDEPTTRTLRKLITSKMVAAPPAAAKPAAPAAAAAAPAAAAAAPAAPAAPAAAKRPAQRKPAAEPAAPAAPAAEAPAPTPAPTLAPLAEAPAEPVSKQIALGDTITVRDLAAKLNTEAADVIRRLVTMGHLATVNQTLTRDVATKVAGLYGFEVQTAVKAVAAPEAQRRQTVVKRRVVSRPLQPRPPVVTILGHVDHGKTTLLDAIRKTDVVSTEFGGITQHIGAYQTEISTQEGSKRITFVDTPGHAAFTQMRARGAQVTDIVILVVAADDGVMPQTIEAINHARAAKVPIIVAVNKVDKEDANVDRTKQQLMEHGLVPEEWGGETIIVEMSAREKLGVDDLLEMITLVAEMEEIKADPAAPVAGTIIEAKMERGRGPVSTVLVQEGTLKLGDVIVANTAWGRIRAMTDDRGRKVIKAGPSSPVEVIGLSSVPMAGDKIEIVKDEREAREITDARQEKARDERVSLTDTKQHVSLQDILKQLAAGTVKQLNIILKADVQGSAEVLRDSLSNLTTVNNEVTIDVLHTGIGAIGESDVMLASASDAVVIGFNVKVDPKAKRIADDDGIDVRIYNIIYELLDDMKAALRGMLEPVYEERILGNAEVRALFRSPRGAIAGCIVTDGRLVRGSEIRILRGKEEVFKGKLSSLRHIKEDVREMAAGFECGLMIDGFNAYQEGDVIQAFAMEEVHRA